MQFRDPRDSHYFDEREFEEIYGDLKYSAVLSDGVSRVEVLKSRASDSGHSASASHVRFEDRWRYARAVTRARLEESSVAVHAVRQGLYSVVPKDALRLLSWAQLQERVCGSPKIDLNVLRRHTVYAPKRFTDSSPFVQQFWQCLQSFTDEGTCERVCVT